MEAKMVVKTKLYLIFILGILSINSAYAQNPYLSMFSDKEDYSAGDNILVYAVVQNINANPVSVMLESLLTNEKETFPTGIIPHEFNLNGEEKKSILLYNISVDENFISDKYTANVRLLFDRNQIAKEKLTFDVRGTLKEMPVNINACRDSLCKDKSRIFLKYEEVYLNYESDVLNPSVSAVLILPDETTRQIVLPTSIKADQIGTYNLEATASKEGYKTINKKIQFGVIEEEANIQYSKPRIENNTNLTNGILYIIIGVVIISVALFLVYKKRFSNRIRKT